MRPWVVPRPPYDHPGSTDPAPAGAWDRARAGRRGEHGRPGQDLAGPISGNERVAGSDRTADADLPACRAVVIPVIGARSVAQLDEALGLSALKLSDEQQAALDGPHRYGGPTLVAAGRGGRGLRDGRVEAKAVVNADVPAGQLLA